MEHEFEKLFRRNAFIFLFRTKFPLLNSSKQTLPSPIFLGRILLQLQFLILCPRAVTARYYQMTYLYEIRILRLLTKKKLHKNIFCARNYPERWQGSVYKIAMGLVLKIATYSHLFCSSVTLYFYCEGINLKELYLCVNIIYQY